MTDGRPCGKFRAYHRHVPGDSRMAQNRSESPCSLDGHSAQGWIPLLDALPQGVMLVGPEGHCLEVNPAATRILGRDREALLGCCLPDPWSSSCAEDGTPLPAEARPGRAALRTRGPERSRAIGWPRKDRSLLWLDVSAEPVEGGGALVSFSDITEQRARSRQLARLTELYSALSQVNQAIVWSPTPAALLNRICEVMVEFGKFTMAWIGWNDPETSAVEIVSHHGDTVGCLQGLQVRSDDTPLGQGPGGKAIREGRACVINDFLGTPELAHWHGTALRAGFAAAAAIPIRQDGKVSGALVVYASEQGYFGSQEMALLEEASGDVTFALENHERAAQRKRAEEALKESEERYRTQFNMASEGIMVRALTGELLEVNDAFARMHGYSREEMERMRLKDINLPGSAELPSERLERILAGDVEAFEVEHIHRSGHLVHLEVLAGVVPSAGKPVILAFHRDITERKRQERLRDLDREALRVSEEKFNKVFQLSPYAIDLVRTTDRVCMGLNRAFTNLYGYQPEDFIGKPLLPADMDLWVDPADRDRVMTRMQEHGEALGFEVTLRRKDGSTFLAELSCSSLEIDGEPYHLSITRDVTERRQAEEQQRQLQAQLRQAQKLESLGLLAGGVAHDMNNVLAAILVIASANLEAQSEGSPAHRAFDMIAKAAGRGGKMVNSLLGFARQTPSEERELDLNLLLQEQVALLEHTTLSKVGLELELAPGLRSIRGDASALTHAFMNLCVNAVDAMPDNGTLTLRTRNVNSDWIEVRVEDTGIGMPRQVLERAMDPFFTTKAVGKGTGLGLSMAYGVVKAHGGTIDLSSQPGEGTCVRMRFPVHAVPVPRAAPQPVPALELRSEASPQSLEVLLVDDDQLIQESIQDVLAFLGHQVVATSSGEEALAKLGAGLQPDVVILDMNMPGLGGGRTLPRLRALRPSLPVLLSTGQADQAAMDLLQAHPNVTLLPKPFSLNELRHCLESIEHRG